MPKEALDFLRTQKVGVFAVRMQDGTPHAATVHFAHTEEPLAFIFLTSSTSRKLEPLKKAESPASFVVGASEGTMKTLQMDGKAMLADTEKLQNAYNVKFPRKTGEPTEEVFFTFTPTWWRYSDWTLPEGNNIFSSDV